MTWNVDEIVSVTCRHRRFTASPGFLAKCRWHVGRLPLSVQDDVEAVIDELARLIEAEELRLKTWKAVGSYFAWPVIWSAVA